MPVKDPANLSVELSTESRFQITHVYSLYPIIRLFEYDTEPGLCVIKANFYSVAVTIRLSKNPYSCDDTRYAVLERRFSHFADDDPLSNGRSLTVQRNRESCVKCKHFAVCNSGYRSKVIK